MYFNNIDSCKYFAARFNNQPPVPNRTAGEGLPVSRSYVAVCEPKRVGKKDSQDIIRYKILTVLEF